MARCPSCKSPAASREDNDAFPFCSPRCRAVDLGGWFTGRYVVPGKITEREGGEPGSTEEQVPDGPPRKHDA